MRCPACQRAFCRYCSAQWVGDATLHVPPCPNAPDPDLSEGDNSAGSRADGGDRDDPGDAPPTDVEIGQARNRVEAALGEGCGVRCPGDVCHAARRTPITKNDACIHISSCGNLDCRTDFCYGCGNTVQDCHTLRHQTHCPGGSSYLHNILSHDLYAPVAREARVSDRYGALLYFHLVKCVPRFSPLPCLPNSRTICHCPHYPSDSIPSPILMLLQVSR